MTNHFNGLTEAQQERLAILIEECSEVAQAGCKILRHGMESNNNGKRRLTNLQHLQKELGDVFRCFTYMAKAGDINEEAVYDHAMSDEACERARRYLHHQEE